MSETRNRSTQVLALAACCSLYACRFEREPHSPFASDAGRTGLVAPEEMSAGSGDTRAGTGGGSAVGAAPGAPGSGAAGAGSVVDAGAGAGAAGMAGYAMEDAAATRPDAGASGCTPDVAECNPVINTGCPASMQCAIDELSSTLAGYCIFSAPMDAGFCFNSGVTESCPAKQACVGDQCRALCFCDADCVKGECCVEPVGTLGFKVCGAC